VSLQSHAYHVTFTTHERRRVFSVFDAACAAARCLGEPLPEFKVLAWVLMPDHAHCLVQLQSGGSLDATVRSLKGRSAREVNRALSRSGKLWARAYHDRALREEDDLRAVARYIIGNPLRAGLVGRLGDYPFWDAAWIGGQTMGRG
jgi:putative transposase